MNEIFAKMHKDSLQENQKFGLMCGSHHISQTVPQESPHYQPTREQLFDFARNYRSPTVPESVIDIYYGQPMSIMQNLNTREGIVKNKRCWVKEKIGSNIVVEFEDGKEWTLPKTLFNIKSNQMVFDRLQIPLKPLYAGTIHKSQGMTLKRVVIDLRSPHWEHGQLYVALSRVRDPRNICI